MGIKSVVKIKLLFTLIVLFFYTAISCSSSDPSAAEKITPPTPDTILYEYKILPQQTDISIKKSEKPHHAYIDKGAAIKNKLMVFLGGTHSFPEQYQLFPRLAASLGYHVVNINYLNAIPVTVCSDKIDLECYAQFHDEIIFGGTQSTLVNVNESNAIVNRIVKLLQNLHKDYPADEWNQFYNDDKLLYEKFVIAGHSQGGGHAAYLASKVAVKRVIVFCSPNDFSERYNQTASWCRGPFATSPDKFYGLMHRNDEIVSSANQYAIWEDMQMLVNTDTSSADKSTFNNSQALYTTYLPNPEAPHSKLKHNAPIMDIAVPLGANGDQIKKVWKYFLDN